MFAASLSPPFIPHPTTSPSTSTTSTPTIPHPTTSTSTSTTSTPTPTPTFSEAEQLQALLIKTAWPRTVSSPSPRNGPAPRTHPSSLVPSPSTPTPPTPTSTPPSYATPSSDPSPNLLIPSALFSSIPPPSPHAFPSFLKSLSLLLALREGFQIHAHIVKFGFESDLHARNALIQLYASCGCVGHARKAFDGMHQRDIVSWDNMIAGYARNKLSGAALELFRELQLGGGVVSDEVTLVAALASCADAGALQLDEWAHRYIRRHRMDGRIGINTALIDMYSKCGCIDRAVEIFENIAVRKLVVWTAVINGLAINDRGRTAIEYFDRMVMEDGIKPDEVVFISVLLACSHSGLLDEGRRLFDEIERRY